MTVEVTSSDASPTEGDQYTLTCTASGHESIPGATVTYQWSRDSGSVRGQTVDNRLIFNPVDRNDNGTYTCRVTVSNDIVEEATFTFVVSGKCSLIMVIALSCTVPFPCSLRASTASFK